MAIKDLVDKTADMVSLRELTGFLSHSRCLTSRTLFLFSAPKGHESSMIVLRGVVHYLQAKLYSQDLGVVESTLVILDVLVKNCSYRIHTLVGQPTFMKSYGKVTRRLSTASISAGAARPGARATSTNAQRSVGIVALDILQVKKEEYEITVILCYILP